MRFSGILIPVICLLAIALAPFNALADCTNPAAPEGRLFYNSEQNVFQYCRGSDWIAIGELNPGAGGAGCTGPAASEGRVIYNYDYHVLQYCDGDDWIAMGYGGTCEPGGGGGGTSGCTIGDPVGSGICGGHINGRNIIVAPAGCDDANDPSDCTGTDLDMWYIDDGNIDVGNQDDLTDGIAATDKLVENTGWSAGHHCRGLALDGKVWHMPSVADLLIIRENMNTGAWTNGAFSAAIYFTANEQDGNNARTLSMDPLEDFNVLSVSNSSFGARKVRCVTYEDIAAPGGSCTGTVDCPNVGDVCTDGFVFAGCAGDDNHPFFVTRCDAGQTWDGSACTGTRVTHYWANSSASLSSVRRTFVADASDGQANTAALTNGATNGTGDSRTTAGLQPHNAAQYCADLSLHNKTDWYLPARQELYTMNANKAAVGNFILGILWSSTELPYWEGAWVHDFSGNGEGYENKNVLRNLRCARHD